MSLDCSRPESAFVRAGFAAYLHGVMPLLVRGMGGDRSAYRYLAESTSRFLTPGELDGELRAAGFTGVEHRLLMFGSIALHVGVRP